MSIIQVCQTLMSQVSNVEEQGRKGTVLLWLSTAVFILSLDGNDHLPYPI